MAYPVKDPWDWTAEEVVENVCRSGNLFDVAGFDKSRRPQPAVYVEAQIRKHDINGFRLLASLTEKGMLKQLGIAAHGQQTALLGVIQLLRSRSTKYKEMEASNLPRRAVLTSGIRTTGPQLPDSRPLDQRRVSLVTTRPLPARPDIQPGVLGMLNATTGEQLVPGASNAEGHVSTDEWDYLAKAWPAEELADEPDDERTDVDDDMSTISGVDEEEEEKEEEEEEEEDQDQLQGESRDRKKMAKDEIQQIIDQYTAEIMYKWFPGWCGDSEDDIADDEIELWHEHRSAPKEAREKAIADTERQIVVLEDRLNQLCDELLKEDWRSEDRLRKQCGVMETTINFLLQERWERHIYRMESPPAPLVEPDQNELPTAPSGTQPLPQPPSTNLRPPHAPTPLLHGPSSRRPAPTRSPLNREVQVIDLGSSEPESESESEHEQEPSRMPLNKENPPASANDMAEHSPNHSNIQDTSESMVIDTSEHEEAIDSSDTMIIDSIERVPIPLPQPQVQSQSLNRRPIQPAPTGMTPPPPQPTIRATDLPDHASYNTVSKWAWPELVAAADRKRIILKALSEMSATDLALIRTRIATVKQRNLHHEITACVRMLNRNQDSIPGILPRNLAAVRSFTALFLCWWFADDYFSEREGQGRRTADGPGLRELEDCLRDGCEDPKAFCEWLHWALEHTFSTQALASLWAPSQAEYIVISDDERAAVPKTPRVQRRGTGERKTSHKKASRRRTGERGAEA